MFSNVGLEVKDIYIVWPLVFFEYFVGLEVGPMVAVVGPLSIFFAVLVVEAVVEAVEASVEQPFPG